MQENQTTDGDFSYDVVAYPGLIIPQMHPDRLAAIAKLHGMNPASAEKCRVLELGCGNGLNLNWLAYNLPESEFVGIDLAQNHISDAKRDSSELKLQNVVFFQQDVLEITKKDLGTFDYIIAHGLFSWVPQVVREKILSLYGELLNPDGVGFISYNVYPGCYRRRIVMDIMKFHSARFDNPMEKVQQGVGLIDFLTKNTTTPVYQEILKYELDSLAKRPAENIFHDDFSEINQPFYFTEFIAEAEKHNLKFLSESESFPCQKDNLPGEIVQVFDNLSRNTIEYEQYADFLNCRRFRQTLLCKQDVALETEISLLKIKDFYISSLIKPTSPTIDLNPDVSKSFLTENGEEFNIGHNLTKVVLSFLVNVGSHPVKFDDLIEKAYSLLQAQGISYEELEKEIEITATILFQLYSPSAIGFHSIKPTALDYVSEKPIVNKFALWQLNKGNSPTNFHGVGLQIQDEITPLLLNLLDGTRTREDLITELTKMIESNDKIDDKENLINKIPEMVDQNLFILGKMGFLIG